MISRRAAVFLLSGLWVVAALAQPAEKPATQNVIMVMTDGLRWQEVFRGAEMSLINVKNKVKDEAALKKAYWRETPDARREAAHAFPVGNDCQARTDLRQPR